MRRLAPLTLALAILLPASPCWACSCVEAEPKEHAESAEVIFTGTVRSVETRMEADPSIPELGEYPVFLVTLDAETAYKGNVTSTMQVRTATDSAACGVDLAEGARYTVFAYRSGDNLHTGLCSGTTEGNVNASEYGLASHPLAGSPPGSPEASSGWLWFVLPLALAAIGVTVLVVRRRTKVRRPDEG